MLPDKPEDWPRVFEQHLNAGDLDAVIVLYEPEARFVTKSGETLVGRDRIRKVLAAMMEAKACLHSRSSGRSSSVTLLNYTPTLRAL